VVKSVGYESYPNRRQFLLPIAASAIVLLTILAAGLSDLRFAPAQQLNFGEGEIRPIEQTLAKIAKTVSETPFWRYRFGWFRVVGNVFQVRKDFASIARSVLPPCGSVLFARSPLKRTENTRTFDKHKIS